MLPLRACGIEKYNIWLILKSYEILIIIFDGKFLEMRY